MENKSNLELVDNIDFNLTRVMATLDLLYAAADNLNEVKHIRTVFDSLISHVEDVKKAHNELWHRVRLSESRKRP